MTTEIQPGMYPGVPFKEYLQWPALSQSRLKGFEKSPMHGKYAMDHPQEAT